MAEPDDLRRAYRRFVLEHHPDRGGDPDRFRAGLEEFRRRQRRSAGARRSAAGRPAEGRPATARPTGRPVVAHRRPRLTGAIGGTLTGAIGSTVAGAVHRVVGRLRSAPRRRPTTTRPPRVR